MAPKLNVPVAARPGAIAPLLCGAIAALGLAACGSSDDDTAALPQLSAAQAGSLANCASLSGYAYSGLTISAVAAVSAGAVTSNADGVALTLPAHCLVQGSMNPRTGIDGKSYAIRFEMRLPNSWNGRFFHQVNGGNDGDIGTDTTRAYGRKLGGSPTGNGLIDGFAVLSSDAGHAPDVAGYPSDPATGMGISGQVFGLDPQARRDYGYNAVAVLTPMAKGLIAAAYGRGPDRSYMVGCSNGGRHGMVAAARFAADYDGILAGDPGFNLPKARVAEEWDLQALMTAAQSTDPVTGRPAVWSALSKADLTYLNSRVLAKCDALDGTADGMVSDVAACQSVFSLAGDVATCAAGSPSDGSCLTRTQKSTLARMFGGPRNSDGKALYADWPWAHGLNANGWMSWKMGTSNGAGTGIGKYGLNQVFSSAGAYVFSTPPVDPAVVTGRGSTLIDWTLAYDFDKAESLINGTTATFTESAMALYTPPNPTDLSKLKNRGAKLLVYHGTADPVFSFNDTLAWYKGLAAANGGDARDFARLFAVPGMNHCSGGPATDQFDMVTALVAWVEQGKAPDLVTAKARTAAQNGDLGTVAAGRSRPLCAWPKVARYGGSGSIEDAASFSCQ